MGLHPSGFCGYCLEPEMREHMLLRCRQHSEERKLMMDGLREMGMVDGDDNDKSSGRRKEVLNF